MNKRDLLPLRIMEYCWLIIGVCAVFIGAQGVFYAGITTDTAMYFVVAALSGAMFVYRRKRRKKMMGEE